MVKRQNNFLVVIYISIAAILVVFKVVAGAINEGVGGDITFLYNRCYQIYDCLRNGYWPFLYYNDLGGIGYGSPIFYGQLTLFPFIVFLYDIRVFTKVYVLCAVLLNFFGFREFVKRYSSFASIASCFYVLSVPFIYMSCRTTLYAALLGTGISWFFLAFCVDWFRDGKNFYLLILTYYLTWQSNLNSAILAVIACFVLFVAYFDKKRIVGYLRLFLCVFVLLLYNFVNILIHTDALRFTDVSLMFDDDIASNSTLVSLVPLGSLFLRSQLHDNHGVDFCVWLFSIPVFILLLLVIGRYFKSGTLRYRVCTVFIAVCLILGYLVGVYTVWPSIYPYLGSVVQFPIRYMVYLVGAVIVLFAVGLKSSNKLVYVLLVVSVVDCYVTNPSVVWYKGENFSEVYYQMIAGEFAGSNFVNGDAVYNLLSTTVSSKNGYSYGYENLYNGVAVDCSGNGGEDVVLLPKLYYNGYHAYDEDGEEFEVISGYSNYCQVDIGSYTGLLTLRYEVPPLVLFLFWIQVFCVSRLLYLVLKSVDWKKFLQRKQKVSEAVSG